VPFGSENEIVGTVDDSNTPPNVTFHCVPDGNPASVNVTPYIGAVIFCGSEGAVIVLDSSVTSV